MDLIDFVRRQWLLGLLFGATTLVAVDRASFGDGIALLCGATAILNAVLLQCDRGEWKAPIAMAGIASVIAVLLAGKGSVHALVYSMTNVGESVLAVWLLQRLASPGEAMHSVNWFARFVLVLGIIAPLIMLPVAPAFDDLSTLSLYLAGHSLGSLAFTPLAMLVVGSDARRRLRRTLRERGGNLFLVTGVSVSVAISVFAQERLSLLFLTYPAILFATFRLGRIGAALSVGIVTLIGGWASAHGSGPVQLMALAPDQRLLFFQLYIAVTVMTALPIAFHLHERARLLAMVRESEGEFRMLAEHCTDAIMRLSHNGEINYVSPAVYDLTGYRPEELIGLRTRVLVDGRDFERVVAEHRRAITHGGSAHSYCYRIRRKDGEVRWLEARARAINLDVEIELLAIMRDVTDAREREAELSEAALTDRLTGLPNRRALEAMVARLGGGEHCLALLDLDRFKQINDNYGHDCGDAVLKGFGDLARRLVRTNDFVARIGGEEFVILFENSGLDQAYQVCDRMRRLLGQTFLATPSGPLRVTVSGGVAMIGRGGLGSALKAADEALYRAKRAGRDQLLLAA